METFQANVKKDKKLFDQMLCYSNLYNSAGSTQLDRSY